MEQGVDSYSGWAWYRLKIQPQQLAQIGNPASGQQLSLMISGNSVGQLDVFVNGIEAGHSKGMTESPSEYQSPPFVVQFNPASAGPTEIAIRTWAGPTVTINRGLLDKVQLGAPGDVAAMHSMAIGHQWDEYVIANMVVAFLFICVAILGGFLYLAQRNHIEYLWLGLLCLSVAAGGAADSAFGLAIMPLGVYRVFTMFTGRIFMAITLEFVLHFTGDKIAEVHSWSADRRTAGSVRVLHPTDTRISNPVSCL